MIHMRTSKNLKVVKIYHPQYSFQNFISNNISNNQLYIKIQHKEGTTIHERENVIGTVFLYLRYIILSKRKCNH